MRRQLDAVEALRGEWEVSCGAGWSVLSAALGLQHPVARPLFATQPSSATRPSLPALLRLSCRRARRTCRTSWPLAR